MIAVIFEVTSTNEGRDKYFCLANKLKDSLVEMPGFISVERFESLIEPGKYLSLSFWEDETAVANWRSHGAHYDAQQIGRNKIFRDYRLRVANVVRDYGLNARKEAPNEQ